MNSFQIMYLMHNRALKFRSIFLPCVRKERFFCDQNEKDKLQEKKRIQHVNAKKKLLSLLSDMPVSQRHFDTSLGENEEKTLSINDVRAKPNKHIGKKKENRGKESPISQMMSAIKSVSDIAINPLEKETIESDLKDSLKNNFFVDNIEKAGEREENVINEMTENMISSVKEVASVLSDNSEGPDSELAKTLLSLSTENKLQNGDIKELATNFSIEDLFEGMKIDSFPLSKPADYSQNQREKSNHISISQFRKSKHEFKRPVDDGTHLQKSVDIFSGIPLNIFFTSEVERKNISPQAEFWNKIESNDINLLTHAPKHSYDEMIQWTKQGKHWKLPIDNQCDMQDEECIGFHEHVFLEEYLHGFPTSGAIRHFMELVCVGLSKNPYITLQRKIENIDWYRNYFKDKEHILKEYEIINAN